MSELGLDDLGSILSQEFTPEFVGPDDFGEENGKKRGDSTDGISSSETFTKSTRFYSHQESTVFTVANSLEVVNFARSFGRRRKLSKSEFVTWALRLEIRNGTKAPYPVNATPLPNDVHPIVFRVYEGFVHLLECRWHHTPNEPAPFTYDFAACWCSVTERQAREARHELKKTGAIVPVGKSGMAKLWLPPMEG